MDEIKPLKVSVDYDNGKVTLSRDYTNLELSKLDLKLVSALYTALSNND